MFKQLIQKAQNLPQSIVYLASSIGNAGFSFLVLPIFLHYLTPEDVAIFDLFRIYNDAFTAIIFLNSYQLIIQKYYTKAENREGIEISTLAFSSLCFLLMAGLAYLFQKPLGIALQIPAIWMFPFACHAFLNVLQLLWMTHYQALEKAWKYTFLHLATGVGSISFGLLFVIFLGHQSWQGRFYGSVASASLILLLFLLLLPWTKNYPKQKPQLSHFKEIVRFGVPLLPQALGALIVSNVDRLYLTHMKGQEAMGIYSVGARIGNVVHMIIIAVNRSIMPKLFEQLNQGPVEDNHRAVRMIYKVDLLYIGLAALACLASPPLFWIFINEEFHASLEFIYWLLPAQALFGITLNRLNVIVFTKKTHLAWWSTDSLAAAANALLCPVLIYSFGAIGAAQSTFFSYLLATATSWYAANRALPLPWWSAVFQKAES